MNATSAAPAADFQEHPSCCIAVFHGLGNDDLALFDRCDDPAKRIFVLQTCRPDGQPGAIRFSLFTGFAGRPERGFHLGLVNLPRRRFVPRRLDTSTDAPVVQDVLGEIAKAQDALGEAAYDHLSDDEVQAFFVRLFTNIIRNAAERTGAPAVLQHP